MNYWIQDRWIERQWVQGLLKLRLLNPRFVESKGCSIQGAFNQMFVESEGRSIKGLLNPRVFESKVVESILHSRREIFPSQYLPDNQGWWCCQPLLYSQFSMTKWSTKIAIKWFLLKTLYFQNCLFWLCFDITVWDFDIHLFSNCLGREEVLLLKCCNIFTNLAPTLNQSISCDVSVWERSSHPLLWGMYKA